MKACRLLYTFAMPVMLIAAVLACEVAYEPSPPQLTAGALNATYEAGTQTAQAPTATATITPTPTATATPTATMTSSIEEWERPTGTQWIIELPRFKTEVPVGQ